MALDNLADDYFSKMNSIASRMYVDMNETKSAYEDLWHKIPEEEQKQILSEVIIKPEISIKYKPAADKTIKDYAAKFVIEDNCTYRDEHSAPFCFKTRSQRDLSLFQREDVKTSQVGPNRPKKSSSGPKLKAKRISEVYQDEPVKVDEVDLMSMESTGDNSLPKTGLDFLDNW